MRILALRVGLMLLGAATIFVGSPCRAQSDNPPVFVENNIVLPRVPADTGPLPAVLPAASSEAPMFGLDLMLGQMTGLRVDGVAWRLPNSSVRVEGFYGALLTKFGSAESAGAGLRWQTRRTSTDGCHAVVFGPGCDVLFHLQKGNLTMIAPTVELAWCKTIGCSAGWVLGINAGIGVAVSGRDTDGDSVVGQVTPLISGFTGFRY